MGPNAMVSYTQSDRERLRVLIVSSEWPTRDEDISGIHVVNQAKRLREAGIEVDVYHFRGKKNPARYLAAIANFRRKSPNKYDIIHAHHGQSGLIALCQRSCPVVVTYHGSDLQGIRARSGSWTPLGFILRGISHFVAHFASEVIVVSENLNRYLPQRSYHVIPAGIDTELFSPMPQREARLALKLPLNEKLVLFVGNPERAVKRYGLARNAVDIVTRFLPVKLVLANGVPHEKMPLYMNACDGLLVTSANEGSPNAVKEALSCNLPVVSVDVGDLRQRIGSIPGCMVCNDDRPETIADALKHVLERGERVNGRDSVRALDERFLAQQVITVYKEVLARSTKR
jgi:glycosyltransferase involved in cell wall biosynthesis